MPAETPGYIADGTIYPCRFVKQSGPNNFRAVQATGISDQPLGISAQGVKYLPGNYGVTAPYPHAELGDPVWVHGDGTACMVEAGAAFTGGDYLIADANGKAVPCSLATAGTVQGIGARALESATAAGQLKRVLVMLRPYQHS